MTDQPTLRTQRLVLRRFALADGPAVQRLAGAAAVADTTLTIPHPYEDGMAEAWIATHAPAYSRGENVVFAITDRDGLLIGAINLRLEPQHSRGELGYWIGEPYWGLGYATEAVTAVIDYGFATLGLNRVEARHLSRNPASGRVMQKAGMRHEGQQREHVRKHGRFEDLEYYGILRTDREQANQSCAVASPSELRESLLSAWRTNNRITLFLFEHLPPGLWSAKVPGAPRRTIRMIAGHLHNARCMWIKVLGQPHGITVPPSVNRHRVGARQLLPALRRSSNGIIHLLQLGCEHGGTIPATRSYQWRNLPLDVGHVLGYFIAHEGHHRGQIVLAARALGHRLPAELTAGLWQWSRRAAEAAAGVEQ